MSIRRAVWLLSLLPAAGACGDNKADLQPLIPASITSIDGDNQTAAAGGTLPNPLRVRVIDGGGNAAPGVAVSWTVVDGGGTVDPAQSTTGGDGIAVAEFTLGPGPGQQHAQASLSGVSGSPVLFTATATVITPPPPDGILKVLSGGNNVPERYSSDLWVHGSYAYTGTWGPFFRKNDPGDVLKVWSLSASGVPRLIDSVRIGGISTVSDVQVSEDGQILMLTTEFDPDGGLYLYSLADPAQPTILGRALAEGGLHTGTLAEINGRRYAFGARNPGLQEPAMLVYDVTDPTNIALVATVPEPADYGIHDTFVRDGLAFAFVWNTGVIIYDVGNGISGGSPAHPVEVGRLVTATNGGSGAEVHNGWWFHNPVSGENRYLFIGQEGPGVIGSRSSGDIHVVDVSDLHHPQEVAFFHLNGAGTHNFWMDEQRQILYAAYYNAGVVALDVSGTLSGNLSGRLLSQIKPGGNGNTFTWGVQLANGSLYAIDMLSGLWQLGVE
ncbi:MAG: Ig-like domain-containing protein [Gemmatimonadales bacterium]